MLKSKTYHKRKLFVVILSLLPFLLVYLSFNIFPILYTLLLSFTDYDGLSSSYNLIGFNNYTRLFHDPVFWLSLGNTLFIWIFSFVPQLICALILASLLTYGRIKGGKYFKIIFYFPCLVTTTALAVLFAAILDWQTGSLNGFLIQMNIIDESEKVQWLLEPMKLRFSVAFIVWFAFFGQNTIIVSAALTSLSKDVFEAAKIEGCNSLQIFWHITIPLMRPVILYMIIMSIIGGIQAFDLMNVMTDGTGGAQQAVLTMIMYMYNQSFKLGNFGYGASVAWMVFMVILFLGSLSYFISKKSEL